MSTKFEQLLDYLVNEDMESANALFHEIVVEKSRNIYENLIAEEEDDEEMDESKEEDDEEMDESKEEDDEEMDESKEEDDEEMDEGYEEMEDSYSMEAGDDTGDETDDFGGEISASGDNFDSPEDDEHGHEGQEDSAIMDIKNAIQELEAAFAELEQAQGSEESEMGMDPEMDMDMDDQDDQDDESMGFMEGRRMTREYVEKVGHDWDKNAQKGEQHKMAGAGSGDNEQQGGRNTKSIVSSGKGKPETGASAHNLLGSQGPATEGHNTGNTPNKVNKGITPEKGEKFTGKDWETNSAPGGKAGVKNLKKQGAGYPGNNKTPGPVGSGTGDKAGQTSGGQGPKGQFLPQHTKN
jgi:hypothetical protein